VSLIAILLAAASGVGLGWILSAWEIARLRLLLRQRDERLADVEGLLDIKAEIARQRANEILRN
jgi:hypothetical protein